MSIKKVCLTFLKSCLLESVYKSRFVWFWQNSEARAVVLSGQLPLQLGQQAVAVHRGVAASRFVGRQDLMAYKGLVMTLGSMITIPMVWSM